MRHLILVGLSLGLTACGGSGGGSSGPVSGAPGATLPSVSSESITLKTNGAVECFLRSGALWCRGSHFRLPSITSTFSKIAEGNLIDFSLWDDSLCVSATVSTQPINRAPGVATYCAGEASFDPVYSIYPVVYGGFNPSASVHGSTDFTSAESLISGADMSLSAFSGAGIVTDGNSTVSQSTATCVLSSGTLTCPTFSIGGI